MFHKKEALNTAVKQFLKIWLLGRFSQINLVLFIVTSAVDKTIEVQVIAIQFRGLTLFRAGSERLGYLGGSSYSPPPPPIRSRKPRIIATNGKRRLIGLSKI